MKSIRIGLISITLLFLGACEMHTNQWVFRLYECEQRYRVDNGLDREVDSSEKPQYVVSLKIQLPEIENLKRKERAAASNIRLQMMEVFVNENCYDTSDIDRVMHDFCRNEWARVREVGDSLSEEFPTSLDMSASVELMSHELLQYKCEVYWYKSFSAHPEKSLFFLLFDKRTGHMIEENDIFDFSEATQNALAQLLQAQFDVKFGPNPANLDYLSRESVLPNGNFEVSSDALIYHFDPYEVAPYSEGFISFSIPSYQLEPFMKKNTPLYRYWFNK